VSGVAAGISVGAGVAAGVADTRGVGVTVGVAAGVAVGAEHPAIAIAGTRSASIINLEILEYTPVSQYNIILLIL
jgi:hypothetical protein